MIAMLNFLGLVVFTMLAAFLAVALDWVLLRAAFRLMEPAAGKRPAFGSELVDGTRELVRRLAPLP